ncbi:uncharacterized protein [Dysidea avara]|uniref:uncharacterized protein isoform X2 n=1 Tax=Dysidea avara TaxID=196820 RepID=UPI0033234646
MEKLLAASFFLVCVTSLPVSEKRDYRRETVTEANPQIFNNTPVVSLSCRSEQIVNVTWKPTEDITPEHIQDRLQNCQATINCTNKDEQEVFSEQDGCPYFTSTGLNGGWQWILNATLNATTCTVAVTFVDFNDPFSSPLTNVSTCTVNNIATD